MRKIIGLFLVLVFCGSTIGQNTMKMSEKQIVKLKSVNQSLDTIWWQWTTHEGLKTFFGNDNKIELFPGGAFEIYFLPDAPIGQKGSEGCKILSFLPKKYFSFSWNAPPKFDEVRNSLYKTWVVVEFMPISENQTLVKLTHLGWPDDEKWMPVFNYFDNAWDIVLNNLEKTNNNQIIQNQAVKITTGIGGIFFKCKDPKKMKDWYKTHLGFDTDDYGTNFVWWQGADSTKKGYTQWSPFSDKTKYFEPSTKDFMINYRVENLDALVEKLKLEGVTITDSIETYEYGKFVHIMDVEGNKIELWEPYDDEYSKIVGGNTK